MKQAEDLDGRIKHKEIQKTWDIFREMGKNAVEGQLSDTSINHDQYLYGRKSQ